MDESESPSLRLKTAPLRMTLSFWFASLVLGLISSFQNLSLRYLSPESHRIVR